MDHRNRRDSSSWADWGPLARDDAVEDEEPSWVGTDRLRNAAVVEADRPSSAVACEGAVDPCGVRVGGREEVEGPCGGEEGLEVADPCGTAAVAAAACEAVVDPFPCRTVVVDRPCVAVEAFLASCLAGRPFVAVVDLRR